jgi:preprotein translocase subunit SecG
MIILFIVLIALLAIVLFLRGEGDSYGKGNAGRNEKRNFGISDKNFFL